MRLVILVFMTLAFLSSGCSAIKDRVHKTPSDSARLSESPEIAKILLDIGKTNSDLFTFKGTGKIRLWKKEGSQTLRSAWIGAHPDKIRIVLQGVTGVPVASMATDGSWLYLFSYTQDSLYKTEVRDPSLERLVSIPVTTGDIIKLISGIIPVRQFALCALHPDPHQDGYILTLQTEKGVDIEKIYMDKTKTRVTRIEIFSGKGRMAYSVDFEGETEIEEFMIPARLVFRSDEESGFQLDIDKFWPNAPASSDMFVIAPSG